MEWLKKISGFAGQTFGLWVIVFAGLGFACPDLFSWISSYMTIFLGIIMFGMGLTLQADDFKELIRKPWHVVIGVAAQFTIMPLTAFCLSIGLRLRRNRRGRHSGRMLSGRYGIKRHDVFGERQYGAFCCGHHDLNIACSYCNAGTYYAVCERVAPRFFRFTVCFHYASRAFADRPRGDCEAVLQKTGRTSRARASSRVGNRHRSDCILCRQRKS